MFFAFTIFLIAVFLFDLKVVVGTVVVQDFVIPFAEEIAVFVGLRLYEVTFLSKDAENAIDVMQSISRRLKEILHSFKGGTFAVRLKDPCIDEI